MSAIKNIKADAVYREALEMVSTEPDDFGIDCPTSDVPF